MHTKRGEKSDFKLSKREKIVFLSKVEIEKKMMIILSKKGKCKRAGKSLKGKVERELWQCSDAS